MVSLANVARFAREIILFETPFFVVFCDKRGQDGFNSRGLYGLNSLHNLHGLNSLRGLNGLREPPSKSLKECYHLSVEICTFLNFRHRMTSEAGYEVIRSPKIEVTEQL